MQGSVVIQRTRAAALSGPFKKIELGTRSLLSDLSMAPGIRRPTDEPSVDLMRSGSFEPKAGRCVIDGRMSLAAGPRAWLVDGMGVMFANHDKRPTFRPRGRAHRHWTVDLSSSARGSGPQSLLTCGSCVNLTVWVTRSGRPAAVMPTST